ncbi:hypothetical protein Q2T42_30955 [Leptolyngbya boryana CZ1]|uniref:Uncharacterized protein n=1 Tax=Leptolyngbya boryana CZ1 TaxID=3060204 RepID=A0AA97AU20_LEPBY|nr:hypothetical protein [Leptolyngbya boryana]WNZ46210.1 hypothetical protein Q2T42_30955 [Leptolyngbya boryana CZ1]
MNANRLHLSCLKRTGAEWLAGSSAIQVSLKNGETSTWVVLAATSVDSARCLA